MEAHLPGNTPDAPPSARLPKVGRKEPLASDTTAPQAATIRSDTQTHTEGHEPGSSAASRTRTAPSSTCPDPAQAPSPAAFSPTSATGEEVVNGEGDSISTRCHQIWFICVACAGALIIPFGLVLLGYLSGSDSAPFDSLTVATWITRSRPGTRGTVGNATRIEPGCSGAVDLNDNITNLAVSQTANPERLTNETVKFFCLYNNSRFRKNDSFDYVPQHLPWKHCPYVIYWSMSIEHDHVESRVPEFDRTYGIWNIKNTSDRLSDNQTKVLMALGGYPEDSPQFSRLGDDSVAMDTLVADVVNLVAEFRLDGIAIHWVVPTGKCQPSNVIQTLSALLGNVKRLFVLNNLPALITLILPFGDNGTVGPLESLVDFFFFMTHDIRPQPPSLDICLDFVTACVKSITRILDYDLHQEKLCIGISTAPLFLEDTTTGTVRYSSSSRFPGTGGRAPVFEVCHIQRGFAVNAAAATSCNTLDNPYPGKHFLYLKSNLLTKFFFENFKTKKGGPPSRCALIVDLDFNNYKQDCSKPSSQHHQFMQALYYVAAGGQQSGRNM